MSGKALALDVSIRSNLLSYAVYARERQLVRVSTTLLDEALSDNESQLQNWVRNDPWLRLDYEQVNILWCDARFSAVPSDYAQELYAESLARHLFQTESYELLRYSDCGDKKLLFTVSENIYYALRSRFRGANHEHIAGRLLNWYMDPSMDQDILLVNHGDFVQLLYREGDKLQFCHSFPYSTASEAAYFVLNSMEKLSVNRETATLRTLGLGNDDELFHMLDTYIRKVKGVQIPLPDALKNEVAIHPLLITLL